MYHHSVAFDDQQTRTRSKEQPVLHNDAPYDSRERRHRSDGFGARPQHKYSKPIHVHRLPVIINKSIDASVENGHKFSGLSDPTGALVDGSQPSAKALPVPGKLTYRVRGIPVNKNRQESVAFLQSLLKVSDVVVDSLARDVGGRTENVATVRFPTALPTIMGDERDAWTVLDESVVEKPASVDIDLHFSGLTPLYSPANENAHEIDFIAVHGLAGFAIGSFKDRTPKSSYVWLRDSLPTDLPHARIMTYGYNVKLANSESFATIDDMAAKFCRLLRDARSSEKASRRPIIFAAHSLGGLVLKAALGQMSKGSKEDQVNLQSTRGILCFGVPSQGMETKHMRAIIQGQENESLLISLNYNSIALEPLHDRFLAAFTFEDSKIISFHETELSSTVQRGPSGPERTGEAVVLVNQRSARNGRPKLDPESIPINKDHSNLVKFAYRDEHYTIVKNEIIAIAKDAVDTTVARLEHFEQNLLDNSRLNVPTTPRSASVAYTRASSPVRVSSGLGSISGTQYPDNALGQSTLSESRQIEILVQLMRARHDVATKESRELALEWAVSANEPDVVEFLLHRKTDPDTHSKHDGVSVLTAAAAIPNEETVQILLAAGADPNSCRAPHFRTPLYYAAGHGKKSLVHMLIRYGANPNDKFGRDRYRSSYYLSNNPYQEDPIIQFEDLTPLYNAVRYGHRNIVETLLDYGASPMSKGLPGNVAHAAAYFGKIEVLEMLNKKGIDDSSNGSMQCHNLLHMAVFGDQLEMATYLLDHGFSPNHLDNTKCTPLHYACSLKRLQICQVLLKGGADVQIRDGFGKTPMYLALDTGDDELVQMLREHGADVLEIVRYRARRSTRLPNQRSISTRSSSSDDEWSRRSRPRIVGSDRFEIGNRHRTYDESSSRSRDSSVAWNDRRNLTRGTASFRLVMEGDHHWKYHGRNRRERSSSSEASYGRSQVEPTIEVEQVRQRGQHRRHNETNRQSRGSSSEESTSESEYTEYRVFSHYHTMNLTSTLSNILSEILFWILGIIWELIPRRFRPDFGVLLYRRFSGNSKKDSQSPPHMRTRRRGSSLSRSQR